MQSGNAEAEATNGGSVNAQASQSSTVIADASNGSSVIAEALNGSETIASDSTSNTVVCAYAANGATATGSDTNAPRCMPGPNGGIAVVVGPAGSCGPVNSSPCGVSATPVPTPAGETPEIDPSMTIGGLSVLLLGLVLLMERRRAAS